MVIPTWIVSVLVTITNGYHHIVHLVDCFIVYRESAHNYIIGHLYMTTSQCAIFMHYLVMKALPRQGL